MSPCANILLTICVRGIGVGRIVEEPEDGSRSAPFADVSVLKEVRGCDLETDAEEGVDLEAEVVAELTEVVDLAFVRGYGGWHGLVGFAVDELAKVESPGLTVSNESYDILGGCSLFEVTDLLPVSRRMVHIIMRHLHAGLMDPMSHTA